jgi:hypothetical protein
MYFPWVGLLEQLRLADVFVHYDDVQFTRGFYNRVEVKTAAGPRWITVPLQQHHRGQKIDEVQLNQNIDWRRQHRAVLLQAYQYAPFRGDMLSIVDNVFSHPASTLGELSRATILLLAEYFDLVGSRKFIDARLLNVRGRSSQRLHDIVRTLGGSIYITGHGAKNYLDHELFEQSNIAVQYMRYQCLPYPQLYGPFTPYVTALDLVANCGRRGRRFIVSDAVDWRTFLGTAEENRA